MRVQGFISSLCFGLVAAIAVVFAQHAFAPIIGSGNVLALYLATSMAAYAALIGRTPRIMIRNAVVAAIGSSVVLTMASGIEGVAIGLTIVLMLVRTGLDVEMRSRRALFVEAVLGCGALAFASGLASPGWLGSAAAIWGFALVQSLYYLAPVVQVRPVMAGDGDPFDRARDRLLILLDET